LGAVGGWWEGAIFYFVEFEIELKKGIPVSYPSSIFNFNLADDRFVDIFEFADFQLVVVYNLN
jgi:hypothetical protein